MTAPDLGPGNYPAEPPMPDLDALPCRCSRHSQESAGAAVTAMDAGFGMTLPAYVTTCSEPDRPNDPDVQRFWREVDV